MGFPPSTFHFPLRAKRGGFALLITVTLLAFLVVLLVGLASYLRVETAVAGNIQRQAQARQNALLGLQVALGQLQKYAGPDQRVTATAESFGGAAGTRHFTGVWSSDPGTTATPTPLTWLVSGNELQAGADPLKYLPTTVLTTAGTNPTAAELVGTHTSAAAGDVIAPLVSITAVGLPGNSSAAGAPIGRYAWWVGDQGVKAPVALGDPTTTAGNFAYAPYDSAEILSRVRQQISLGAGAADASGAGVFEPRDANNSVKDASGRALVEKVAAYNQLAFLRNASAAQLGLTPLKTYFHSWSPNNFAVLANTRLGGLREDLSLAPAHLGPAFAAWTNYSSYMEDPKTPQSPAPLQPYASDPIRRRYIMQPVTADYPIAPVLSFFGLSFSIRNDSSDANLEVAARSVVGLWNPYSAALVPDTAGYQLRITGLPNVTVTDSARPSRTVTVNLHNLMSGGGTSVDFYLPWTADGNHDDRSSWLPGRVYNWSADATSSGPGTNGYTTIFYERNAQQGTGIINTQPTPLTPSTSSIKIYRQCSVDSKRTLTVALFRLSDGAKLAEFTSPQFDEFSTSPGTLDVSDKYVDFAFIFRMPDSAEVPSGETATWLQGAGRDPREPFFPANGTGYVMPGGNTNPALFGGTGKVSFDASFPDLLLDRYTDSASLSYNEDVPVFELPRAPLLSVGQLQHFRMVRVRPFAIGNSWGQTTFNSYFDRFFFSGLTTSTAWTGLSQPLPNPLLTLLKRKADNTDVDVSDINGATRQVDGYSSKHLLQGGAFNLNSTDKLAWIAVLRSVRFPSTANFKYLDADAATGTAADLTTTLSDPFLTNSRVAVFPRFSQSAQEVFKADPDYKQSQFRGGSSVTEWTIDTPLFRRGIRVLSAAQVAALAQQIVTLVQQKHADSGPFQSLQEFLSASRLYVDSSGNEVSLLEKAIEAAGLNDASNFDTPGIEFSSQWLTQGDVMTALAPVLFPRSDTFVIRAYGDAVNPTTSTTAAPVIEGRAWCEAIVQRVPDYFDASTATGDAAEVAPAALTSSLNQAVGRRFKIVSFRWLTRSDI